MVGNSPSSLFSSVDVETLRGVIDAVPHPIFVKDEATRFLIVNEMMCSLMDRVEQVPAREHNVVRLTLHRA